MCVFFFCVCLVQNSIQFGAQLAAEFGSGVKCVSVREFKVVRCLACELSESSGSDAIAAA